MTGRPMTITVKKYDPAVGEWVTVKREYVDGDEPPPIEPAWPACACPIHRKVEGSAAH